MWYTATSASVNTGENIVSINSGDDLSLVQESSGLIFEGESPVEVIRSYIDTGGNHKIRLASAWPYASKVNEPLIAYPTDADFAAATAELRRVLNTMEVASLTEAQLGEDDEKIMTPLKVKAAIDVNTPPIASLTEAQEGTEDTKIMTSLKTKAAIDFNTGTAATEDTVTSIFDYTIGRVKTVGHGILQANPKSSAVTSAGNKEIPYFMSGFREGVNEGWPSTSNWWGGTQFPSGVGSFKPALINNLDDLYFGRINVDGSDNTFGWKKIYNTGNILGTVSQSGGVPTGAIIESGSNVNGSYVKYADGTATCSSVMDVSFATATYLGQGGNWTLPIQLLAGTVSVNCSRTAASTLASRIISGSGCCDAANGTLGTVRLFYNGTDSFISGDIATMNANAHGKWY